VALSPLAIRFWEKLLLEPCSYTRDIAYIVVAPDNDFVLQKTRTFFRELSSMYEVRMRRRPVVGFLFILVFALKVITCVSGFVYLNE